MPMTIKSKFRMSAGYDTWHKCKDCKFCLKLQCGAHSHYKCKIMGITGSAATDIRLKDYACRLFEQRGEEE